jgi:hypothetical protein
MTPQLETEIAGRRALRALFALLVVGSAGFLVATNGTAATTSPFADLRAEAAAAPADRTPVAPSRNGTTVITSHREGDLFAVAPNGTVVFHVGSHDGYWDVDPSPVGDRTVLYAASDKLDPNEAACQPVEPNGHCVRQTVERLNLTTGEVTRLYSRVDPRYHASEWHDVDRLDDTRVVIADMYRDSVLVVNVTTDTVAWAWNLQSEAPLSSGGPYPDDWAHLNDVEVLADGRIVVSLRNQDQVVFLDPPEGVQEGWTLGAEDDYDTLYEQHNPDYIPERQGGPALLVADSENNRVVEYQRVDGAWQQSWLWRDPTLQWPRDADRLPNGHTLVTDTAGGRVVEVDRDGEVVWTLDVPRPYEAERLSTGDESAGGPAAARAELASRGQGTGSATVDGDRVGPVDRLKLFVRGLFPTKVVNAIVNGTPVWMGMFDLLAALVGVATLCCWVGTEAWWAGYRLRRPVVKEP